MVQPLREQSLLVVSEWQKGSAQGRILGGPRGPWPTLFLWKFENYFYRILACFPATGFLNFLDPSPASADRLEQNLGDNPWSSLSFCRGSRVEGRGFHVEGEGTKSRAEGNIFFSNFVFLDKVIIDAIIKTNKKNLKNKWRMNIF